MATAFDRIFQTHFPALGMQPLTRAEEDAIDANDAMVTQRCEELAEAMLDEAHKLHRDFQEWCAEHPEYLVCAIRMAGDKEALSRYMQAIRRDWQDSVVGSLDYQIKVAL